MTPLSWAGLGFSLGTLWGLSARPSRWLVLGLLLGSLFAALFWKERKKGGILIFFLLPAFFIGALSGRERQSAASRMAPFLGNPVRLTGRVEPGSLRVRDRSVSFTLLYEGMRIPVLHLGTLPGPSWGTYTAEGCLEPIETFYNPGMVDETKRSAARKIPGRIRTQNGCLHYEGGEKDALDRIAEWGSTVRKRLSEALPPREAALLGGMLLGGSEGMDASSLQIFTACGLSHLLSVSGSHVALLLGLYVLAAEYLPLPRPVKPLGGLFFLFCYAILCGLRASVCRAVLLGSGVLLGELLGRRASGPSFLGFSALLLLGIHPFWIWDIGFALSFAAAAGLMLLKERVERGLASFLGQGLGTALSVPLAAHIFSLPLLVHHFHAVSLLSLPANLLLVPLLSLSLVLAVSAVFGGLVLPFLGRVLFVMAGSLVSLSLELGRLLSESRPFMVTTGPLGFGALFCYGLLLSLLLGDFPQGSRLARCRKKAALASAFCLAALFFYPRFQKVPFTAYFLDVGQGDCCLLVMPDRKNVLIDTGGLNGHYEVGERVVVPALRALGVTQIDTMIISHGHHDHAGGAAGIARWLPVKRLLLPQEKDSNDVEKLIYTMKKTNHKIVYKMQKTIHIRFKSHIINIVDAPKMAEKGGNANESSAVVLVACGKSKVLLTGDATSEIELAAAAAPIRSDVLKVSHHGSSTSSEIAFLKAVSPKVAVISVGRNNRFGHPHDEVLERLEYLGIPVARTDEGGAIKVVFDETGPKWYSYRCQRNCF